MSRGGRPDFKVYFGAAEEVTYPACCHCGKIRFMVTMPPLDTLDVVSCNCSICAINGYLNVYPLRTKVVFQSGLDDLASYRYGKETRAHKFCKTCGTSLLIDLDRVAHEGLKKHMVINVGFCSG